MWICIYIYLQSATEKLEKILRNSVKTLTLPKLFCDYSFSGIKIRLLYNFCTPFDVYNTHAKGAGKFPDVFEKLGHIQAPDLSLQPGR